MDRLIVINGPIVKLTNQLQINELCNCQIRTSAASSIFIDINTVVGPIVNFSNVSSQNAILPYDNIVTETMVDDRARVKTALSTRCNVSYRAFSIAIYIQLPYVCNVFLFIFFVLPLCCHSDNIVNIYGYAYPAISLKFS